MFIYYFNFVLYIYFFLHFMKVESVKLKKSEKKLENITEPLSMYLSDSSHDVATLRSNRKDVLELMRVSQTLSGDHYLKCSLEMCYIEEFKKLISDFDNLHSELTSSNYIVEVLPLIFRHDGGLLPKVENFFADVFGLGYNNDTRFGLGHKIACFGKGRPSPLWLVDESLSPSDALYKHLTNAQKTLLVKKIRNLLPFFEAELKREEKRFPVSAEYLSDMIDGIIKFLEQP